MKETKQINITIEKESQIYNQFNNSQLSPELSNYILDQVRGTPYKTDIVLNVYSNFKMTENQKEKLVKEIRENYGLDIRENLLKLKFESFKQIILLFVGLFFLLISHLIVSNYYYLISQSLFIFGWVLICEWINSLVFVNIKIRYENKKYIKLTKAKIIFNENNLN